MTHIPPPLVSCCEVLSYFQVCSAVIGLAQRLSCTLLSCCSSAHSSSLLEEPDCSCPAAVSVHISLAFSNGPQLGPVFPH